MSEVSEREAVIAAARRWIGTRWEHRARVRGSGVDCGQLLAAVYEEAGVIQAVDPGEYPPDWHLHRGEERFLELVELHAARREGDPVPGDILLFRYGRTVSHGGISLGGGQLIHAFIGAGRVVVDDLTRNVDLGRRLAGAWNPWGRG